MPRWAPLRERLFSQLIVDPSGCLLWAGRLDPTGYGRIVFDGTDHAVHRTMYEMFAGPVPDGLQLDHLCRVRNCANVGHLEPVTAKVNVLRGIGPTAVNAVKTHCPAGHEYDLLNTYICNRGLRNCRECRAAAERARRRRKTSS